MFCVFMIILSHASAKKKKKKRLKDLKFRTIIARSQVTSMAVKGLICERQRDRDSVYSL